MLPVLIFHCSKQLTATSNLKGFEWSISPVCLGGKKQSVAGRLEELRMSKGVKNLNNN